MILHQARASTSLHVDGAMRVSVGVIVLAAVVAVLALLNLATGVA